MLYEVRIGTHHKSSGCSSPINGHVYRYIRARVNLLERRGKSLSLGRLSRDIDYHDVREFPLFSNVEGLTHLLLLFANSTEV